MTTTDHEFSTPSPTDPLSAGADNIRTTGQTLEAKVKWIDSGTATITPVANTPTSVRVNFNFTFPTPPHVVATANTGVIETTVKNVSVQSIDETGFTLWVVRSNDTNTAVEWIAHG